MANKQMKTMNTFIRPMLAAALFTAAACSPLEETHPGSGSREAELSVSVAAEGQQVKGMITDSMLPDGSELCIGLFNPDGSNYMGKNYGHLYYVAENGQGGQIWKTNGTVVLGESEAVLYAYYPYDSNGGGDIRNIPVKANNFYQDDFMYAVPCTGLDADNRHANITMKHALAAVRLTTRRGTYDGTGSIRSIGVGGTAGGTSGYMDVTQGRFTKVTTGGTIYPTTSFQLSDGPNIQHVMLIPSGSTGNLTVTMTIDDTIYNMTVPDVLLEAGKITQLEISVDKGRLTLSSVKVAQWSIYDRGNFSAQADYRVALEGNQEGISIGTVIGTDGTVTITAVPYVSKDAKVNPVSFDGNAECTQTLNESTGVRTILIQEIKSHVTVTFDGFTL